MLSNKNKKVYYNPTDNKLLVSVACTDKFPPKDNYGRVFSCG